MADNLKLRRPYDAQKINLTQAYEQGWWLAKFGFRRTELPVLKRIIKAIGSYQVDEVSQWIQKNKRGIVKRWRDECRVNVGSCWQKYAGEREYKKEPASARRLNSR